MIKILKMFSPVHAGANDRVLNGEQPAVCYIHPENIFETYMEFLSTELEGSVTQ